MSEFPLVLAETLSSWYVVACVVIPLAWGLGTEFVFRIIEHHRRKRPRVSDKGDEP